MADRDGYIAGVPAWVDTSQPDPETAQGEKARRVGWMRGPLAFRFRR